jgi:glucan biosynthesis protein C
MEQTLVSSRPRLAYVDNLRWLMIVLVVLVHVCVTYSGLGSWYYKEERALDAFSTLVFYGFEIFCQAFFMGLLFLLAGYFVPTAYDRKGCGRYLLDRLVRLGAPTAVFMFILHPVTALIRDSLLGKRIALGGFLRGYGAYLGSLSFLRETGPLWFALALLGFSILYGVVRRLAARDPGGAGAPRAVGRPAATAFRVKHGTMLAFVAILAAASFAVRMAQPIGSSWYNLQLCFFPQYVVLFVVGLWAARSGFLAAVPHRFGMTWLRLALFAGIPGWLALMAFGGALAGNVSAYAGGLHWQAAAFALWEAFFCVGIILGLLVLFRDRRNTRTRLDGFLSDNAFGVYVFHTPLLVGVSLALAALTLYPLAKALLVAAIALPGTFLFAALVRRVPALKRLFS